MSILEALREVAAGLPDLKSFFYADLNEANAVVTDKLARSEFPIVVVLPINPVDTIASSGLTKTTVDITASFLMEANLPTTDYDSSEIEVKVIAPMRLLARKFIHKLNEHSIIDPETSGITSARYTPIYLAMDAGLFGVAVQATVPVIENPVLCD